MKEAQTLGLVMIVDDNPVAIEMLSNVLAGENVDIAVANDGETVLAMVQSELPDLILLDVLMPGIDGIETCRRLRADPATKDIPVVLTTALDDARHRLRGFEAGATDYVTKPFEEAELRARVRTQLALRGMTRALQEKNARMEQEIRERRAAEASLEELARELGKRTEELRESNVRLSRELLERERAEGERAALQEQIIRVQQDRLLELSTPLVPITDEIVAMPLIGAMDVDRARQVVATALQGSSLRRAAVVILDITGVPRMDVEVAQMLVQAAAGLRLLGARAVITGVRPEVARALVALDVELGDVVTKASLQDGIAYAMSLTGAAGRARPR